LDIGRSHDFWICQVPKEGKLSHPTERAGGFRLPVEPTYCRGMMDVAIDSNR
jgi:hypothetical protein